MDISVMNRRQMTKYLVNLTRIMKKINEILNVKTISKVSSPVSESSGLSFYYLEKIEELQMKIKEKRYNIRRLQFERNDLNMKVRQLREELKSILQECSYVADVIKILNSDTAIVKIKGEGELHVEIDDSVDYLKVVPNSRVAIRSKDFKIYKTFPKEVDPAINLMKIDRIPDTTFDMIGGLQNEIREIKEVIELPIKHPELFESLGIDQPKGVLLYGPPGTGKTLLARAVAHHTDCTFVRVSGSEFVQKYIGEGTRLMKELFDMAKEHAPCIIFIDEVDSIGSSRFDKARSDSEVQRTLLELFSQLDGFDSNRNIKIIMATNRIDVLDKALIRSGRIDKKIEFRSPNEEARMNILKIHSHQMNLYRGINFRRISEMMEGASGAEIKAVCTEAGMFALRENRIYVTQNDFEMAVTYVMKKSIIKDPSLNKQWT
ncbi:26S proteasome regulatory subunit 8-like isoform X1 [Centruroides sculpturatus]|uniref:26S proteasome regulatory subunit 8-like isoform X1 n=2 Tax=Centruroides sculpturatus TaxID=218467 RepID=UPI000C6CE781|nr:26S proteasome regulatory subunit 8-like isoform X1 [Centruroides sculpturatus]XP_023217482.1 26S proteasome regulatory subunit 8-like isoform X1 [Centruroides sculpturatus]